MSAVSQASPARRLARNLGFGFGAQLLVKLASFAFNIFLVRSLGAEAFGQYAAIGAFGQLWLFVADLGLATYGVRRIAQLRDHIGRDGLDTFVGDVAALRFLLALLASALTLMTAALTGQASLFLIALALNGITLLMYAIQAASSVALAGLERMDLTSGAQMLYQVLFVGFGALALLAGFGYMGVIAGNILAVAIFTVVCVRAMRSQGVCFGRINAERWPAILRASAPFALITLALGLSYKFDTVLIETLFDSRATGYYNAAYNLIFNCVLFSNVLNSTLFPALARQASRDESKLAPVYERTLRYLLAVALPLTVGLFFLADDLVPFLFKDDLAPAAAVLKVLIWVVPLQYVSEFLGYAILIAGREQRVARSVLISSLSNVGLNLLVTPHFGLQGAAIMTVLTEAILVVQYVWLMRRDLLALNWRRFALVPALCAVAMGMTLAVLGQSGMHWLLRAVIGAAVYIVCALLTRMIGQDELTFLRGLRRQPA
jgi:O-antigen/teichoic acid export membrane protein